MGGDCDGCEGINLDQVMAPLSRDSLELVVALCIERHADCYDLLLSELRKPVDISVIDQIAENLDAGDPDDAFGSLSEMVDRARSYADSDCVANATVLLRAVTGLLASKTAALQASGNSRDEFWAFLEQAWDAVFDKLSDYEEMKALFAAVAAWRQALVGYAGPVLSEPLRTLKKRIEAIRAERPRKRSKAAQSETA